MSVHYFPEHQYIRFATNLARLRDALGYHPMGGEETTVLMDQPGRIALTPDLFMEVSSGRAIEGVYEFLMGRRLPVLMGEDKKVQLAQEIFKEFENGNVGRGWGLDEDPDSKTAYG